MKQLNSLTYIDDAWISGNPPIIGPISHGAWLGSPVFDGARAFDGMAPDLENCVFSLDQIRKSKFVLDVPTNPIETKLIRLADSCGKQIIPGHLISLHQAARQFELYTKTRAPLEAMKSAMLTLLS